jgi:hypothetical protein
MPKYTAFSFLLAGINPLVFFICQIILLFNKTAHVKHLHRSFLAILGDIYMVPFLRPGTIEGMLMRGEMLRILVQLLTSCDNHRHHQILTRMILQRILNRMILQVGAHKIEQCMQLINSYRCHLGVPPLVSISLNSSVLDFMRIADNCGSYWFNLFLEFSNPHALQHLIPSDNPNVQLAIVVREFREMYLRKNKVFMSLLKSNSYESRKRTFFKLSRTTSFKQFNKSFRLLQKVFRDQLDPSLSHYDTVRVIINLFFHLMDETNSRTFTFLSRVFAEESSENLRVLLDQGERYIDYHEFFSYPYQYPKFNPVPSQVSIRLLQRLGIVHSLKISQDHLQKLKRHSDNYHDDAWKSIWSCGLYWIVKFSSIIQNGDPFLNFIFHSILEGQDSVFYFDSLQLFLNGAKIEEDHSYPEFYRFWVHFKNMRGRYIELGRRVSFSDMFFIFLDILENPHFFGGLQQFCSEKIPTQVQFQQNFTHFVQSMQNTNTDNIFRDFFYPRVYVMCRICNAKIWHSRHCKSIRMCEECSGYDTSLLTDDDD